jgi:hypothetical protein
MIKWYASFHLAGCKVCKIVVWYVMAAKKEAMQILFHQHLAYIPTSVNHFLFIFLILFIKLPTLQGSNPLQQ